jgi:hypothetical protein
MGGCRLIAPDQPTCPGWRLGPHPSWQPVDRLRELRALLTPGGTLALVLQPRTPGARAQTSQDRAGEMQALVTEAGFTAPRVAWLDLDPPGASILAQCRQ